MHPAAKLQFERIVVEFARWRAVAEDERPPAPAWWWGPAFELRVSPWSAGPNGVPAWDCPMARLTPPAPRFFHRWPARRRCRGRMIFRAR